MARNTQEIVRECGIETEGIREQILIPPGRENEEESFFISVNGVNYVIPKGVPTMVPRFVAEEYRRSQLATRDMREYAKQKEKEARKIQ